MPVLLTSNTEADIRDIVEYYESNRASSLPFRLAIREALAHLEAYPETATRRRDLTRRNVLFWLVKPYWLVLQRNGDLTLVLAVQHCAQELGSTIQTRLEHPQ